MFSYTEKGSFVVVIKAKFIRICVYLIRKGSRHYADAVLGASVAHSPKKLPSIVVRFTLNLRHLLTSY